MEALIGFAGEYCIAFGIVAGPSVEMDRGMVRVGRVADVMTQEAGVIDDSLLDPLAFVRVLFGAPQAELDAKALKQFEDSKRGEAGGRGFSPGFDQFGREFVTVDGVERGGRNE